MQAVLQISDAQIKKDVLAEIHCEPSLKLTDIAVWVKDGVVTLTGFAPSYSEKCGALSAAQRVAGVRAVAQEIQVRFFDELDLSDSGMAASAAALLDSSPSIPQGSVQITVADHWVTLEGEVEWRYQKMAPETALHYLKGMKGLHNRIVIKQPEVQKEEIESAIQAAFERSAMLDAEKIEVSSSGNKITLRGQVPLYLEREEAERVAWGAAGVMEVDNQIQVVW